MLMETQFGKVKAVGPPKNVAFIAAYNGERFVANSDSSISSAFDGEGGSLAPAVKKGSKSEVAGHTPSILTALICEQEKVVS